MLRSVEVWQRLWARRWHIHMVKGGETNTRPVSRYACCVLRFHTVVILLCGCDKVERERERKLNNDIINISVLLTF
jgi:hypothetical protein